MRTQESPDVTTFAGAFIAKGMDLVYGDKVTRTTGAAGVFLSSLIN